MFLVDFFLPNRCLECNRTLSPALAVCAACYSQIHFSNHRWAVGNPLRERCSVLFPVSHAFALMLFEKKSLAQKIIHQLKYNGRENIGKEIASWTFEALDFSSDIPDLMITIPLHPKKQKKRGYNQLHLFTRQLSEHYGIPCSFTLLKRDSYGKAQAKKNKFQRTGTKQLFNLTQHISGKHILIIDDVFTTGNTMSAAAWEILKDRTNRVSVLVMAMEE